LVGAITRPLAVVEAEGGVVVGQAAQLDLGRLVVSGVAVLGAQRAGGGDVVGIADRLVPRPAALMAGDQPPVAPPADAFESAVSSTRRPITDGCTE
jgi:hypothetical protein